MPHYYFSTMKHIDTAELVNDFCTLAPIEGISLKENKVADYIKRRLEPLGIRIVEQSIPVDGSQAGNVICIPEETDTAKPVTVLAAHMDTVRSTANLKPVVRDGVVASDGTTILGADNRAGVAALLYMFQTVRRNKLPLNNIIVLFTVAEEIGMVGARNLDLAEFPAVERVFVFDCSKRPGVFIQHCYGCLKFSVDIRGKPAHAGVAPERGVNAIAIAADIINAMPQGRLPGDATFNVGTITGGEATNVVSSDVRFTGEIRGPSMEVIEAQLDRLKNTAAETAERYGGKTGVQTSLAFAPFCIDPASDHFKSAGEVLRKAGLKPEPIVYTGGSDANAFNEKGIPAVNFGIGAQQPHSNEEFILVEDLVKATEMVMCAAIGEVVNC